MLAIARRWRRIELRVCPFWEGGKRRTGRPMEADGGGGVGDARPRAQGGREGGGSTEGNGRKGGAGPFPGHFRRLCVTRRPRPHQAEAGGGGNSRGKPGLGGNASTGARCRFFFQKRGKDVVFLKRTIYSKTQLF